MASLVASFVVLPLAGADQVKAVNSVLDQYKNWCFVLAFVSIGLNPDLDYGAGAYYYADIPEGEKALDWEGYTARLPFWVYLLLFLGWGALMWAIWKRLDK